MKKIFCFLFALTFFAACGDSGTNAGDSSKEKAVAPDLRVESMSMLPNCTETHKGEIALVTDFYNTYKCENGEWALLQRATVQTLDDLSNCAVAHYDNEGLNHQSYYSPRVVVKVESEKAVYLCNQNKWSKIIDIPDGSHISSFEDPRDGQVYKTVKIGKQVWMAENLNYKTDSSSCYNDSAEYCEKYGRLYTWTAAAEACPIGWHIPVMSEWDTLFVAVGGTAVAGWMLKSFPAITVVLGEKRYFEKNGEDIFSFSVLPAGNFTYQDQYGGMGMSAYFWSHRLDDVCGALGQDACPQDYPYGISFSGTRDYVVNIGPSYSNDDKIANDRKSVRCLKD